MSSDLFHLQSTLQWYVYMQSDDCFRDHCAIFDFEMTRHRLLRVVNCVISIVVTAECPPPAGRGEGLMQHYSAPGLSDRTGAEGIGADVCSLLGGY